MSHTTLVKDLRNDSDAFLLVYFPIVLVSGTFDFRGSMSEPMASIFKYETFNKDRLTQNMYATLLFFEIQIFTLANRAHAKLCPGLPLPVWHLGA